MPGPAGGEGPAPRPDPTFLAPPGEVADWRMVLAVDAAAGHGVLEGLPGTVDELAGRLGLERSALQVLLDALAVYGVVERDAAGRYAAGPSMPGGDAVAGLRHHARALRRWSATLEDRLRGRPPEIRPGMPDPELFIDALAVTARSSAPALVDICLERFPDARSVIDLGGGHGEYALEFARRGLHVTLQDLPVMVDAVRRRGRLTEAGVELVAASFFEEIPAGPFDLAFCAGITHTFDGEHNRRLYARLRPVVSGAGGVAVVTFLRRRNAQSSLFAVQMLANGNGGDSHAEEDYRDWLGGAGFTVDRAPVDLQGRPQSVLFATRPA